MRRAPPLAILGLICGCVGKGEAETTGASWFDDDTAPEDTAPSISPGAAPCTAGPLPLCINEIMPDNDGVVLDEAGEASDWLELVNLGDTALSLDGFSLSDDAEAAEPFLLNQGNQVEAGGYLILWADGAPELGPQHLGFKLDADGECALLYDPDGRAVDLVCFGSIPEGDSAARQPDGGEAWVVTDAPSPGAHNPEAR